MMAHMLWLVPALMLPLPPLLLPHPSHAPPPRCHRFPPCVQATANDGTSARCCLDKGVAYALRCA